MFDTDESHFKGHPQKSLLTLSNVGYVVIIVGVFFLGVLLSPLLTNNGAASSALSALRIQNSDSMLAGLADKDAIHAADGDTAAASSSSSSSSTPSDGRLLSVLSPAESELESAFADFTLAQTKMNNELSRELHELRQRLHVVEKIILLNKDKFVVSKGALQSAAQVDAARQIQTSVESTENKVHEENNSAASASSSRADMDKTCKELKVQYKVAVGQHWGELPINLQQMWKELGCDSVVFSK